MTDREIWDIIRSLARWSLRNPSTSGNSVILQCLISSNSGSAHKPAGITPPRSLSGTLLLKPLQQAEALRCSWQTLGSKESLQTSFGNLLQGLIPLTKVPSATPSLYHVCLWRGKLRGRSWRCFADWRNKQVSVQLGSTTSSPSIRCRNVFLTANITCGTRGGPGSTVPSLLARARTLAASVHLCSSLGLRSQRVPWNLNSHLPRGARKQQQLLHPFPSSPVTWEPGHGMNEVVGQWSCGGPAWKAEISLVTE